MEDKKPKVSKDTPRIHKKLNITTAHGSRTLKKWVKINIPPEGDKIFRGVTKVRKTKKPPQ